MTTIILDIDDNTLSRVAEVARARRTSIEDLLKERAQDIARLAPIELDNRGHRDIVAALDPAHSAGMSEREKAHDRAIERAEAYTENRARLLHLIDTTEGDMGRQGWDRRRLYDR